MMAGALIEAAMVLVLVALIVATLIRLLQAGPATTSRPQLTRWQAGHSSDGAATRVSVDKVGADGAVLESRLVEVVRDDDPDYDARFLDAISRAQSRADVLNSADEP